MLACICGGIGEIWIISSIIAGCTWLLRKLHLKSKLTKP